MYFSSGLYSTTLNDNTIHCSCMTIDVLIILQWSIKNPMAPTKTDQFGDSSSGRPHISSIRLAYARHVTILSRIGYISLGSAH